MTNYQLSQAFENHIVTLDVNRITFQKKNGVRTYYLKYIKVVRTPYPFC